MVAQDHGQFLIQGFARTMGAETQEQPIVTLDLVEHEEESAAACIARVLGRLWGQGLTEDTELAEQDEIPYLPPIFENGKANNALQLENGGKRQLVLPVTKISLEQAGPCRLFAGTPGLHNHLHYASDERV